MASTARRGSPGHCAHTPTFEEGHMSSSRRHTYQVPIEVPTPSHCSQPPCLAYPTYTTLHSPYSYPSPYLLPSYGLPCYPSLQCLPAYPQPHCVHPAYPTHPHSLQHHTYPLQHSTHTYQNPTYPVTHSQPTHCHAHTHVTPQPDYTYTCHTPEREREPASPRITHAKECPRADVPRPPSPTEAHSHAHASLLEQIEAHKKERKDRRAQKIQEKHEKLRRVLQFDPTLPPLREVPLDAQWEYFTPHRLHETRDLVRALVATDPVMQERMREVDEKCVTWSSGE